MIQPQGLSINNPDVSVTEKRKIILNTENCISMPKRHRHFLEKMVDIENTLESYGENSNSLGDM